ncbi:MAG: alpha-N-arabinofuranosidase [Armatimonadetes bacterium]|nr:alpha-N-arabinofuranosidase [Armatimonadota bacterium]
MAQATITLYPSRRIATIQPNLYGHFIEHLGECVYGGIWVGEGSPIANTDGIRNDVVQLLRRMRPPVVRWPGGCFADDYHWEHGIGPRAQRRRTVNLHWGETVETNAFGTHEFLRFCELLGAAPYICGNVGSGSPRELRDWVEYCNFAGDSTLAQQRAANGHPEPFRVRFWGVGNENWGCGGNLTPEEYATEYRRFATYLRSFSGTPLTLIACGPSGNDPHWTRRFFTKLGGFPNLQCFAAHYYCGTAGTATNYTVDQWYQLLEQAARMEPLIVQQRAILDGFDPQRRIGLIVDEWGTWHPPAEERNRPLHWQQNTIRDALVAALTLDTFNRHADKVVMGNIAQMLNVLQAVVLTEEDRALVTPTGHVYTIYAPHQGAEAILADFAAEPISYAGGGQLFGLAGSASLRDDRLFLTAVNPHASEPVEARLRLVDGAEARGGEMTTLAADDIHAHNTFEAPETVKPATRPLNVSGRELTVTLPPASVNALSLVL